MDRNTMGKLIATRSALQSALNLLSIEQLRILQDAKSGTLADLTQLWSSRGELSSFQEAIFE